MKNPDKEPKSRLDSFASGIILQHLERSRRSYKVESEKFLLSILPTEVKMSPVALKRAVETLPYSSFVLLLHKDIHELSFEQYSREIVDKYYSQMYAYRDHIIFPFAIAEWVSSQRTRLTEQLIQAWEKDSNPETQEYSQLRAKGARECIFEGIIRVDDMLVQNTLYKFDPGLFRLLQPGVEDLKTYGGSWNLSSAKDFASASIRLDEMFVRVPYQTVP